MLLNPVLTPALKLLTALVVSPVATVGLTATATMPVAAVPSAVTVGVRTHGVDGTDVSRTGSQLVRFTPAYGATTRTSRRGFEAQVVNGKVVRVADHVGNMPIPAGGSVLSGRGASRTWLKTNAKAGAVVRFSGGSAPVPTPTPAPTAPVPTPTPAPAPAPKLLIKYGQDIPSPAQFAANRSLYESRPFDGWVLHMPVYSAGVLSSTAYSQAQFAAEIAKLPTGLVRATHNWVRLIVVNPLDFSDQAQWTTITDNARNLAAALAASDRQVDGIFLDDEWYGSGAGPWNYGSSTTPWDGAAGTTGATGTRDLVRTRGRQFMDAIAAGWPTAKVMALYGPWVGETRTYDAISALAYNDVAWANELMGSFVYGMTQSTMGNGARVIDGGEVYGARDRDQFAALRAWQLNGFADSGSTIIPQGEAAAYKSVTSTSVGVYDRDVRNGYALLGATELQRLTQLALGSVDRYAWLYTEEHEWGASQSGKPTVPGAYLDAIRAAVATP